MKVLPPGVAAAAKELSQTGDELVAVHKLIGAALKSLKLGKPGSAHGALVAAEYNLNVIAQAMAKLRGSMLDARRP